MIKTYEFRFEIRSQPARIGMIAHAHFVTQQPSEPLFMLDRPNPGLRLVQDRRRSELDRVFRLVQRGKFARNRL